MTGKAFQGQDVEPKYNHNQLAELNVSAIRHIAIVPIPTTEAQVRREFLD